LRFPGQYYDQETGNYYNYFRDYDPTSGRYLQSDPIGLGGGLNTFVYIDSNPVNLIDIYGLARTSSGWWSSSKPRNGRPPKPNSSYGKQPKTAQSSWWDAVGDFVDDMSNWNDKYEEYRNFTVCVLAECVYWNEDECGKTKVTVIVNSWMPWGPPGPDDLPDHCTCLRWELNRAQ
jgi:RHS repeat-associated protein